MTIATCKLFKRFLEVKQTSNGNALELVIIIEIANLYNWKVSYSHLNNIHTFEIKLFKKEYPNCKMS